MLALVVIDCAEHTILRELLLRRRMPTLGALAQRGVTVPLTSDGQGLDGSVFETLLTGVNPGKHGIHKYQQLVPGTYQYALSKAAASPVPQIWSVLSQQGRKCCVFDVPKAFPERDFSGRLVASWGSYSPAASPGSVPADLFASLLRRFGSHPMRIQQALPLHPAQYERALRILQDAARLRVDACCWLLDGGPWDFFATAFSESHVGAHQFWQLRDPAHPLYDSDAARRCGDAVEKIYEAIDENLARLLEVLPDEAAIVVMTQQGVQHNYSGSHLLQSWLALREGRVFERNLLQRVDEALGSNLRNRIRQLIPEHVSNRLVQRKFSGEGRVFMLPGSEYGALLRVNLAGREPAGVVPREAYRETLDSLRRDLSELRNPATGEPAVAEVQLTHDRYEGPLLDHLPDAVVCWRSDRPIEALQCPRVGLIMTGISFTDITHSMHTSEGMVIIAGGGVPPGKILQSHDIRDVTATLYELVGADPPSRLEGTAIPWERVVPAPGTAIS